MKFASYAASVCALLAILAWAGPVSGQGFQGTIRGTVQDQQGAFIPGVTVTVTNDATGETRTQISSGTGTFNFPNLLVSTYTVTAELPGFRTYTEENVQVSANSVSDVLARLEIGEVTETVVVTAGQERVQLSTAQLEGYTTRDVVDLPNPVLSGNPNNFAILAPGTTTMPGGVAGQGGSIGGNRPRNNNFVVDGVDNNDPSSTGNLTPVIAEAVEEFTLLTNQFSAEYGHSTAGQFITTTRTGGSEIHGRAWWYNQNRHTNSLDNLTRAVTPPGGDKPRYDWNRFGGQVGGPILQDRWFYFTAYEYQNLSLAGTTGSQILVPTAQGLADLETLAGTAGSGVSPVNVGLLADFVPIAATETSSTDVTNEATSTLVPIALGQFSATTPNYDRTHLFLGNTDYQTGSHRLSGRYSFSRNPSVEAGPLPVERFNSDSSINTHRITFSDVFVVNERTVNEFRAGYNRSVQETPVDVPNAPGSTDIFGNYSVNDLGLSIGPVVTPQNRAFHTYEFSNITSIVTGPHMLKFGVELRNVIGRTDFLSRARGDYVWGPLDDFVRDRFPTVRSERGVGLGSYSQNRTGYYAFAQDSWKVHPRLTVEYGLRYELTTVARDQELQDLNSISNLLSVRDEVYTTDLVGAGDPLLGTRIFDSLPAYHQDAIIAQFGEQLLFRQAKPDINNFAPRVGLAWDVFGDGTTSLRAGAGIAYDVVYGNPGFLLLPPQVQGANSQTNACILTPSPDWCSLVVGGDPTMSPAIGYSNIGFIEGGALLDVLPPETRIDRYTARDATSFWMPDQEEAPETYTWSLSVQRRQFSDWVFEMRYIGNHAINLPIQHFRSPRVRNGTKLAFFLDEADALSTDFTGAPTLADFTANTPLVLSPYGFGGPLVTVSPDAQSWYNGASFSAEGRMSRGLVVNASYTFSKTTDMIENDLATSLLNPRRPRDEFDLSSNKGLSGLHRTHKFVASWIYDLPAYPGDNGILNRVLGGWQFLGSYILESGQPITIISQRDTDGDLDNAGDTAFFNPAGQKNVGSDVNFLCWDGTTASIGASSSACGGSAGVVGYVAQNPNAQYIRGQTGMETNLGRNTFIMPGINTANLSLFKNIPIGGDGRELQFRVEMYNAFNHPSFTLGSGTVAERAQGSDPAISAQTYGIPGTSQFLDKTTLSGGMGNAPFQRIIQWGLKLLF